MASPQPRRWWRSIAVGIALAASVALPTCRSEEASTGVTATVEGLAEAPLRLVVIGDYGSGNEDEIAVADDVRRWVGRFGATALVTTGDNVYPEGEAESFDEAWTEPYGWVADQGLPVISSLGNHDVEDDGGRQVMELFAMPGPWYEVDLRDADLFVLDSNRIDDPAQTTWLREHLARTERRWQIVVFHHPAFSCSRHGSTPEVVAAWVPLFQSQGVDLVLTGHDHNYQRFEERNGVTYLVTGGGGGELYELDECDEGEPPRVVANDEDHHFVAIRGSRSGARVQAIAEDGSVIDDFVLLPDPSAAQDRAP